MALIKAALEVGPAKWNFAWGIWSRGRRGNLEGGRGVLRGSGVEIHLIGFGVTKGGQRQRDLVANAVCERTGTL